MSSSARSASRSTRPGPATSRCASSTSRACIATSRSSASPIRERAGAASRRDVTRAKTEDARAAPLFRPPSLRVERRGDGVIELASGYDLPSDLELMMARLGRHARAAPTRTCIAERASDGWRRLTYAEAERRSRQLAGALLARGLGAERPLAILGEASVAQASLRFAALRVGIPFLPMSPGLLRHGGPERLEAMLARIAPGSVAVSPKLAQSWGRDRLARCGYDVVVMNDAGLATLGGAGDPAMLDRAEAAVGFDTLAAV
ncbi:MAG: AMP-binding protein, partial [Alphaproteobacteria bacterium]|nr:AMP-binding protein [Alphaproteobacteria bacterium]